MECVGGQDDWSVWVDRMIRVCRWTGASEQIVCVWCIETWSELLWHIEVCILNDGEVLDVAYDGVERLLLFQILQYPQLCYLTNHVIYMYIIAFVNLSAQFK